MGISLTGLTPATTYDALIKVGDNGPITASLKVLSDGLGTNLPMEASTTAINFTGALQQGGVAVPTAGQVAAKQDTLVSGTNIKTVNSTTILGSGNLAVQDVLVSGTNIKTINGASVLGAGNIVTPSTPPSGVAGAIQFSNGSAFSSDAANFFWDNTNKRLGVGTNAPTEQLHIFSIAVADIYAKIQTTQSRTAGLISQNSSSTWFGGTQYSIPNAYQIHDILNNRSQLTLFNSGNSQFSINGATMGAKLGIQGSGSTSATTSLLVQNSSAVTSLEVKDDGQLRIPVKSGQTINNLFIDGSSSGSTAGATIALIASGYSAQMYISACGSATTGIPSAIVSKGLFVCPSGIAFTTNNAGSISNTDISLLLYQSKSVHINGFTEVASAVLNVESTTKGFLPPRMTTTQKNAIASPAAGLVLYDSTTNKLQCYNGSTWNDLF